MSAHAWKEHHIHYTQYGLWLKKLETSDDLHLKFTSDIKQLYGTQIC